MNTFITPIILIILSAGLFFTFTDAEYLKVKELRASNQQYSEAIANSKNLIKIRDGLLEQYNTIPVQDMDRVTKLLPNNIDNVRLIIDINSLTSRFGAPVRNVKLDSVQTIDKKPVLDIDDGKPYRSGTISFSLSTNYKTFIQILRELENSLRILDIESVKFSTVDTAQGKTPDNTYQFDVTLRTYWMK